MRMTLAILGLLVGLLAAGPLQAIPSSRAVVLAQGCVAEISIQPKPRECHIMWHILLEKVHGELAQLTPLMRRYNSLFKQRHAGHHRSWVLELNAEGAKPPGWPRNWRWEDHFDRWWRAMVVLAQDFLDHPGRHPCPRANHYGGPVDGEHADDPVPWCWERVDCGQTAQAYWYRPPGGCPAELPANVAAGGG